MKTPSQIIQEVEESGINLKMLRTKLALCEFELHEAEKKHIELLYEMGDIFVALNEKEQKNTNGCENQ